jgi:hypothetical protein
MKFEIKKLITFPGRYGGTRVVPAGLNLKERLWWRFMPGVVINLKWPEGKVVVTSKDPGWYDCGAEKVEIWSADPNNHYRPYLEEHIGKQKWDWDWGVTGAATITLKIRRKHEKYATMMLLRWGIEHQNYDPNVQTGP